MKNIRFLLTVCILAMLFCIGCSKKDDVISEEIVTLTDRQKVILEDKGLSTNFNDLTSIQKESIIKIEDVLQYLENKYDKEFGYIHYNQQDFFGTSYMLAHALNDDEILGSFIIDISGEEYTDNYMCKAIRHKFKDYIEDELHAMTKNAPLEVFINIADTSLTVVPENERDFNGNVECSMWIFIENAYFGVNDADALKTELSEWMQRNKISGAVHIILLKENSLNYITSYNFADYLTEADYTYKDSFYINKISE